MTIASKTIGHYDKIRKSYRVTLVNIDSLRLVAARTRGSAVLKGDVTNYMLQP